MDKDGLVFGHITEYMRLLRRERTDALGGLERRAREEKYPIAEPETADMLEIMCRVRKPKRILEIGTCIGFSALLMHDACPDADIVTVERNPVMIEPAKKNLREFGAEDKIKMLIGDAVELLPTLDGTFDSSGAFEPRKFAVIVLDHNSVEKPDAVVEGTSGCDGILLKIPPARSGLAGVENPAFRPGGIRSILITF